jgi:hypothetical protein
MFHTHTELTELEREEHIKVIILCLYKIKRLFYCYSCSFMKEGTGLPGDHVRTAGRWLSVNCKNVEDVSAVIHSDRVIVRSLLLRTLFSFRWDCKDRSLFCVGCYAINPFWRVLTIVWCISKNLAFGLYPSSSVFPLKTRFWKLALLPSSGKRGGGGRGGTYSMGSLRKS